MDSINGISPINMLDLSASYGYTLVKIEMASTKLILDAQKNAGQNIVKMLENLGNNIDIFT